MSRTKSWIHLGLLTVGLVAGGCSDDSDGAGGTGGEGAESVFVVCAFIVGAEFTGFVATVPSLGSDQVFDLSAAIEVGGRPICAAQGEEVFVTDPTRPAITKYTLDDAGVLIQGDTVSFANVGSGPLDGIQTELIQFIDAERAYFIDRSLLQAVIWNPSTMEVIGSVDIPLPIPDGLTLSGGGGIVRRGTTIVMPFGFSTNLDVNASTEVFAFLDTTTDTVTFDTFTECGAIQTARTMANGDTYFASNAVAAASYRLGLPGSFPPCVVRLPSGAMAIDRDFTLELNDLVGGAPAASLLPGPGDSAFLAAYDESVRPISDSDSAAEIVGADAWRVYSVEDTGASAPAAPVPGVPLVAGRLLYAVVDGSSLLFLGEADFSGSTAYDLTGETGEPGIFAPAVMYYAARLR